MTDELLDRVLSKAQQTAYRRRSAAFRWLLEHYSVLAPALSSLDPPLGEIALEMSNGGINGGQGKPLTAKSLAKILERVRRHKKTEEAQASRQASKATGPGSAQALQPSRLPPSWQPQAVSRSFPAPAPPAAERVLSEHAKAELASLDRQLAYRDRFVNPPKKER